MGTANISFGRAGIGGAHSGTLPPLYSHAVGETLTTNAATSTQSVLTAPTGGNRFQTAVRIILDENGHVAIGDNPVANKTAFPLVLANDETIFAIEPGQRIAIIDVA